MPQTPLTSTDIIAAATDLLTANGYSRISDALADDGYQSHTRLFEDRYGIVGLAVYETWEDLASRWYEAQAQLVTVISKNVSSSEAKAWEGYLVLLTPSAVSSVARREADRIRYDTARVRKLVATGEELKTVGDVHRVVLPLLPLADITLGTQESTLEMLPALLSKKGLPRRAVAAIVGAFREQMPLLEKLHAHRNQE